MKIDLKNHFWWLSISNKIISVIVIVGLSVFVNICINKSYFETKASIQRIDTRYNTNNDNLKKIVETNYRDFLIEHYENQINFLNFWLTLLAIFAGLAGIGIPLVMNASYKERIRLMVREFKLQKTEMIKVNNKAKETITILQNNFNDDLLEKIDEIDNKVNKTEIFSKASVANFLFSEAHKYLESADVEDINIAIYKLNEAINIAKEVFDIENDHLTITYLLARLHGTRAVANNLLQKNKESIEDYNNAIKFAKIVDDQKLINLGYEELLQVYIETDDFEKALLTLEEFKTIAYNPRISDRTLELINTKSEDICLVKDIKQKLYEIKNIASQRGDFL